MSRHLPLVIGILFLVTPAAVSQPQRFPRETIEPPLAGDEGAVLTAASREPRPLTPGARWTDAPAPVVLLQVRAPTVLALGKDVDVRLVVENAGRVPAKNLVVIYPLPSGVQVANVTPSPQQGPSGELFWKIDSLAAGARNEFVLTVKPPPSATDFETRAKVIFEQDQVAKTRFTQPEVKVRMTGPEQALCFDILVFGMEVTNSGALELTDVTLTDELPDGLKHRPDEVKDREYKAGIIDSKGGKQRIWRIGRLAPGQTRRVEYYVEAASSQAGTAEHKGLAQAAGGVQAVTSAKVTLVAPKVEVKADAPPRQSANQPARVRVTLANRSPRTLTNVVVTDEVPDACQIDNITGGGQLYGKRIQWIVPALPPNEERVLELTVRQPEGGVVRHLVTAVYRGLTLRADTGTEFDAAAALSWDFRGTPATVEVNGEVTYAVTVQNTGTKPATNVRPVIELPPEVQLVKAEPKEHKVDGARVTFDAVTLSPNGKAIYLVRGKAVKSSIGATALAEMSADVYPAGPVKRHEMTAIGGSRPAPAAPPPVGPMPAANPIPGSPPGL